MKKVIIVLLGVAIVIGGYLIYDQTRFKIDDIVLEFNDIKEIEYGESIDPLSLIKTCSGEVTYQEAPNTNQVGKHEITFVVKEKGLTKQFTYEIEVKDTKAPEIVMTKEKDTLTYGSTFDPQKYIKSVKDPVDGDIEYKKDVKDNDVNYYTYQSDVNTKVPKDYTVKYMAVDKNNNKTEKSLKITVQKQEKEPQTTPSKPNTSSSTYTANPNNKVIVIDPGHQGKGNSAKEAVGPGSSTMKAKVAGGATGVSSRKPESQITLDIGLKLRNELQARGYTVIMTRTSQNVNISNQQRAQVGNKNNAAAVIHLHCDGGASSARGAHTIAIGKDNPYCPQLYKASSSLAQKVISSYTSLTGIKSRGVSYRNDLTGLNWSEVPAIYIEMGFISNSEEDKLLTDSSFQNKCAKGIANGIDQYFK